MEEADKLRKEVIRVSKLIQKIQQQIILSNWKIVYEEVVKKLNKIYFKEEIDEYSLSQEESDVFYWIKSEYNFRIKTLQSNPGDAELEFLKMSNKKKNECNLESLMFDLNQFLEKTQEYNKRN